MNKAVKALQEALTETPALRIGQLISNALPTGRDLFYVSDDELIAALKGYKKKLSNFHLPKDKR